ncbi:hypothetical protein [Methylomicrobium lacus]|uniref:hypothetical protein n=1 Tax=Methylomicrobium lacus TaxID=136992 RepID=UPI0035A8790F
MDTDPGLSPTNEDYSLEAYILQQNHYQSELLANLDHMPESGAVAVVTWPNVNKGSGFPARVLAIAPKSYREKRWLKALPCLARNACGNRC